MNRFLTLKKTDTNFSSYIWGTFSNTERALPIESLNTGTIQESVTFEIKTLEEIKQPSDLAIFSRLIKWNYFFLLFLPLFYITIKNFLFQRIFDTASFGLAALSSIFLFAGLNIRNDVLDHVSGFDRVIKSNGKKPLLLGWTTAESANHISWILCIIAIALAVPVCIHQREAIRVVGITLCLFLAGNFLNKNNYKFSHLSEFILFLILGPALCAGYQVAMGSGVDTEILVFGAAWGVAVLFLLYIVQFANLFETSQAGIKNTLTKMGFDKSKTFLILWWSFFIVLWVVYHYFYASRFWLWFGTAILIFWSFPTFIQIKNTHSPIGSDLIKVRKAGSRTFASMVGILVVELSWNIYSQLNGPL
ncbi:MAG: UbiA family prenyltransferase [Bdellovibrionaceae bacterium]|nr:UbiA family prenyltransferase [Pseudobdellovibrionaceae bacterium]